MDTAVLVPCIVGLYRERYYTATAWPYSTATDRARCFVANRAVGLQRSMQ